MTKMMASVVMAAMLTQAVPATAQTVLPDFPPAKRAYNAKLGWVGVLTMMGGGLMMLPYKADSGAEDWTLFGEQKCVITTYQDQGFGNKNEFDIRDGPCRTTDPHYKLGLITAGIGGGLTLIGFRKVSVQPSLSLRSVGARVAVRW